IEADDNRVVDAALAYQRELLLEGRDRRRAVRRVEHTTRMRLEGDEGRSCVELARRVDRIVDDIGVAEMDPIEAANCQRDGPDRIRRETDMDLQLSTFSGTNVRRSGSVCPRATRRPSVSCARRGPGPGSGTTRTARPCRTCASCSTLSFTRSISGSMTSAGSSRSATASGVDSPSARTALSRMRGPYAVRT